MPEPGGLPRPRFWEGDRGLGANVDNGVTAKVRLPPGPYFRGLPRFFFMESNPPNPNPAPVLPKPNPLPVLATTERGTIAVAVSGMYGGGVLRWEELATVVAMGTAIALAVGVSELINGDATALVASGLTSTGVAEASELLWCIAFADDPEPDITPAGWPIDSLTSMHTEDRAYPLLWVEKPYQKFYYDVWPIKSSS